MPTGFDENGEIDEPVLHQMIDHSISAGVSAFIKEVLVDVRGAVLN